MSMLRRLWNDDQGAIITVEWILIVGVMIFGLIPGFVAIRNAGNASLATIGNIMMQIIPNFTFSGFGITGPGGSTIAQVGGFSYTSDQSNRFTSFATTPVNLSTTLYQVDPTP